MKRKINIIDDRNKLNTWAKQSVELFEETAYLDNIQEVYPFEIASPEKLDDVIRRKIIQAHQSRNTERLIELLAPQTKFPYEDPIWYLLRNVRGCLVNNPKQIQRIADTLYSMTAAETIIRLESPPEFNRQIGPMFGEWSRKNFDLLSPEEFQSSENGIFILEASEEEAKRLVQEGLSQNIQKTA